MPSILDQKLTGYELALLHDLRKKAKEGTDPVASLVARLVEIAEALAEAKASDK
jgi:hypothetical protein